MDEDADLQEEVAATAEATEKVTVLPARPWPVYNVDRARAELIAIEMLTRGASYRKVRHATGLSPRNVKRLQNLVAEEAANPAAPRIVCRTPARIRVRNSAAPGTPAPAKPAAPARPTEPDETAEPVQMTFSLDC
ncbi:hypothetical protein ABR737_02850 [Streptomyces sp. Edi2]|uniref:hypothetical protein n=1 Tax=unclassified Streptomyces TaxID=2593676 RepID=UPI0033064CA9